MVSDLSANLQHTQECYDQGDLFSKRGMFLKANNIEVFSAVRKVSHIDPGGRDLPSQPFYV